MTRVCLRLRALLQFSDDLFEMYREQAERQYRNFSMEQPYQHSMHNLNCLLTVVRVCVLSTGGRVKARDVLMCLQSILSSSDLQPRYHNDSKLGPVASVTPADLRLFIPRLLSRVRSWRFPRVWRSLFPWARHVLSASQ